MDRNCQLLNPIPDTDTEADTVSLFEPRHKPFLFDRAVNQGDHRTVLFCCYMLRLLVLL